MNDIEYLWAYASPPSEYHPSCSYPSTTFVDTPEEVTRVIDAAWEVAKMFPGWNVPREFVQELYASRKINEKSIRFDTQVNELGNCLRERFFSRSYGMWEGEGLHIHVFRENWADAFIREIDWHRSFKEKKLVSTRWL